MKKVMIAALMIVGCLTGMSYADDAVHVNNKICPVSHEEVGTGGMEAYQISHNGKTYNLCCMGCEKEFLKDPDKYAKAAEEDAAASAKQM